MAIFFYFDEIAKMRLTGLKNPVLAGKWPEMAGNGRKTWFFRSGSHPTPLIFAKIILTGFWTYRKPVCGPMRKPVRGPIGNRFVDLSETGLWT